jgi:hypothetical protein
MHMNQVELEGNNYIARLVFSIFVVGTQWPKAMANNDND